MIEDGYKNKLFTTVVISASTKVSPAQSQDSLNSQSEGQESSKPEVCDHK